MGCGDEKLSKYLTQTFIAHCNAMICQQVTLSGDAEWPKVADAVIEADKRNSKSGSLGRPTTSRAAVSTATKEVLFIIILFENSSRGGFAYRFQISL